MLLLAVEHEQQAVSVALGQVELAAAVVGQFDPIGCCDWNQIVMKMHCYWLAEKDLTICLLN